MQVNIVVPNITPQHDTARHGTTRHDTARHGTHVSSLSVNGALSTSLTIMRNWTSLSRFIAATAYLASTNDSVEGELPPVVLTLTFVNRVGAQMSDTSMMGLPPKLGCCERRSARYDAQCARQTAAGVKPTQRRRSRRTMSSWIQLPSRSGDRPKMRLPRSLSVAPRMVRPSGMMLLWLHDTKPAKMSGTHERTQLRGACTDNVHERLQPRGAGTCTLTVVVTIARSDAVFALGGLGV
jgi:hypothetical protein